MLIMQKMSPERTVHVDKSAFELCHKGCMAFELPVVEEMMSGKS